MRKKIGVLAQYLDTRHDVREFINTLTTRYDVVVYLRTNDQHFKKLLNSKVEVRPIRVQIRRSISNHILIFFYRLFGILPSSEQNYFITEFFKLNNSKLSAWKRFRESIGLHISRFTPKVMSYDGYLKSLRYATHTDIHDVDEFLCFTQIYDDLFFAYLLDSGKKVSVYVYSWDHPCKMKTFSKRVDSYLVWNKGLKEDVINLQGIPAKKVTVLGSTQLTYIYEFIHSNKAERRYYDFPYVYFACATGYPTLVQQEVSIIKKTAEYLDEKHPNLKLVVRTYPFFGAENYYEPLLHLKNVVIDDYKIRFDSQQQAIELMEDKLMKIAQAQAIIHFGTTFGLEAAYFNHPVVLADFVQEHAELNQFVHQYQNDKYLNLGYPNICKTWQEFTTVLDAINKQDIKLMDYNSEVSKQTGLLSMTELVQHLLH